LIMMQNVRPHPTSTLLHDTFFSVTFECDCPFLLQVVVAGDGSTTTKIKINTKLNGNGLKLYQLTLESFYSFLRWMNKYSISNRSKDSRLFSKYSSAIISKLSKFRTNDQSIYISWCAHSWALLETSFLCQ
jgi:hypothetical protein